ncbi:MarR family transcriptional regulator [Candidatus Pelagibacter sp.]|nr:MarR family transcriptional regulator [Candidatus Pelagibacter sp.]
MKDLLYLKDQHLKEFIEKLFIGYRESFGDAKKTLDKYSLGIAHHKVIHIISIHEGITISNLLKKLKVTKQSLNRILNDLVKFNIISFVKDEKDSRMKHVHLTKKGEEVFNEIFNSQKKRIYNALINSSSLEVNHFKNVLKKIINE